MEKEIKELTVEEIKSEIEVLMNTPEKEHTFEKISRLEALSDEYKYKTIYEPKGITRFDAGYHMQMNGL